jgi:hypothetical protein
MAAAGRALPSVPDFGRFSGMPAIGLAGVLLLVTVGALGEETGWRGYALPQLPDQAVAPTAAQPSRSIPLCTSVEESADHKA